MARKYFWFYICDDTAAPLINADVGVYIAGTNIPAAIYTYEDSSNTITVAPQVKSDDVGNIEFWIADSSEISGYDNTQKFKIEYKKPDGSFAIVDYLK